MIARSIVEFIIEYQWIILFIIAVFGALAYFGYCSQPVQTVMP